MSDIRARFEAAKEAARRLREAQRELNTAADDAAGEQAVDAVNTAESELNRLNIELNRIDGRTVTPDGRIVEGFPDQFDVEGRLATEDAPGVEDRRLLRNEGVDTADLSTAEVAAKAAELRARRQQEAVEELIEEQTGRPAASLTPDEAAKAVRDAALEQSGTADLLRETRRPGLPDPLDLDDEDIRDDLRDLAVREITGAVLDKDPGSVTPRDVAEIERLKVDAQLAVDGIDPALVTKLERMQAASKVRNDAFDRQLSERLRQEAVPPPSGTGTGGGASGAGGTPPAPSDGQAAPSSPTSPPPYGGPLDGGGTGGGAGVGDPGGPAGGGGEAATGGSGTGVSPDGSLEAPGPGDGGTAPTPGPGPGDGGVAPGPVGGSTGPGGGAGTGLGSEPTGTQVDTVFQASFGNMGFEPDQSGLDRSASFETFHRGADGEWFDDRGNKVTGPTEIDRLESAFSDFLAAGGTERSGSITTTGRTREQAAEQQQGGSGGQGDSGGSGDSGSGSGGGQGGDSSDDGSADAGDSGTDAGDDGSGGDAGGDGGASGTPDDADSGAGLTPDPESMHEFRIDLHSEFIGRMRDARIASKDPLVQEGTPVPEGADTGFMGGGVTQLPPPMPGVGNPGSLDAVRLRPDIDEPLSALTPVGGAINPGSDGEVPGGAGRELDPLAGLGDRVAGDPELTVPGRGSTDGASSAGSSGASAADAGRVADTAFGAGAVTGAPTGAVSAPFSGSLPAPSPGAFAPPSLGAPPTGQTVAGPSLTGPVVPGPAVPTAEPLDLAFGAGGGGSSGPGSNDPIASMQITPRPVSPETTDSTVDDPAIVVDGADQQPVELASPLEDPSGGESSAPSPEPDDLLDV